MDYPNETRVASVYREIFSPEWTIQKLAHSAIQGHLLQKAVHGPPNAEIVGRSIVWKLMLAADSPLDASTGLQELRRRRNEYVRELKKSMLAPDGTFPESLVIPGEQPPLRTKVEVNLTQNNPLSLDESNPWKDYFASLELRKTVQKDVERTFPDVDYFRSARAQRMLADILFVYSRAHEGISYRQGMHELLAPVLWALDYDSLDGKREGQDAEMYEFLSRDYVPADAWAIFSRIMEGVGPWYEWREPKPVATGGPPPTPWIAPINQLCSKIGGEYLSACDPALAARMSELGVEPQMYGIRWLRLLFTREFPWRDALILWDALFTTDPSLQVVPWVCVAMLIRIRNLLIPAEYTDALTCLLKYPPPPSALQSLSPTADQPLLGLETHLLVQQALMLRANPSPSTGATIVLQNRSVLEVPIEAPAPPPPQPRRGGRRRSVGSGADPKGGAEARISPKPRPAGLSRHIPDGSLSGLAAFNSLGERADVIAKGIWDIRGQVGNRVSEIRKNLPDLVRTPSMSGDAHVFPYYQALPGAQPDFDEGTARPSIADAVRRSMEGLVRPSTERQPTNDAGLSVPTSARSPRTRFEVEREVGEIRALMRRLGDGVGAAVEILKDENDQGKQEALESLAYIREVLSGNIPVGSVDDEKVLGPSEVARRKEEERLQAERYQERERERAEAEAEQARELLEREKEKQRQLEEQRAQDPLRASPLVQPAPLIQTSPPRVRTTHTPWGRSEHFSAQPSGLSFTGNSAAQKDGGTQGLKRDEAGNDPLGVGSLG